ncbi:hypothetical protein [Methylocella sp.]|uniref:hypothetical protein n=1 Tax=Methylocella sp. TaxID=1978226 RepID=UPI003C7290A8
MSGRRTFHIPTRNIAVAATGTDVVDKAYTKAHGIVVSNIRNYAFNTVPEHVFALAFALRRNIVAYVDEVRKPEIRSDKSRKDQHLLYRLAQGASRLKTRQSFRVGHGSISSSSLSRASSARSLASNSAASRILT